jgi:hypothetical protein
MKTPPEFCNGHNGFGFPCLNLVVKYYVWKSTRTVAYITRCSCSEHILSEEKMQHWKEITKEEYMVSEIMKS